MITLPKGTDIQFEQSGNTFIVRTPYSAAFVNRLKQVTNGYCQWLPGLKKWRCWTDDFYSVVDVVNQIYGGTK